MIQQKIENNMFSLIFSVLTIVVVKGELVNFGCRNLKSYQTLPRQQVSLT